MDIYKLLEDLTGKYGPSGKEDVLAEFIISEAKKYCDEITTDVLGNVIARKKGNGAKLMFSAHMDSIGLIVTHIEKEGFLRVGAVGGIDPHKILFSPVKFHNGTKAVVMKEEKVTYANLKVEHLLLDIGAKSAEEAEKMVQPGDMAVFATETMKLEGESPSIVSPYMDNRVACGILLAVMEKLQGQSVENDIYFVFSVQEEVGLRGAKPAAYAIDPAYGIAVDVTGVCDLPESSKGATSKLGDGAGVKIMDRSIICHPEVVEILEKIATEKKIAHQRDIIKMGGTDAGVIHTSRGGVKTGGISVPCRYIHSPSEMANLGDIQACIDLSLGLCQYPLEKKS
ncbi:MAG: M42 family metallopeptidase [Eubacteriales bacterium]